MKKYKIAPEVVMLGSVPRIEVPEIKVRFNRSTRKTFEGKITSSKDASDFIRKIYRRGEIELQEHFVALFLNRGNIVLGFYRHTVGTISSTLADLRILLGIALKSASTSIIISHNHPSGNTSPSDADQALTKRINEAAKLLDIQLLDHIIVTKDSYHSFADEGLMGLEGIRKNDGRWHFADKIESDLKAKVSHNKRSIEKLAGNYGLSDKNLVKELTELAIVRRARSLTENYLPEKEKFARLVDLYNSQVNLSHRTSQSMLLQQYSTPAPIAYLAGLYVGLDKGVYAFEPSAGNGLLTIAGHPSNIVVNEIDPVRRENLKTQKFLDVGGLDASRPFLTYQKKFEAVITNPPFGTLDSAVDIDGYPIKVLDHLMAIYALDTLNDQGRAAIIIGGHITWDHKGRITRGKNLLFFNYLYSHYHVEDVINIDGKKLYSRQGTAFPVRLILINGRKSSVSGSSPLKDKERDRVVRDFDSLFERVTQYTKPKGVLSRKEKLEAGAEALAFSLKMMGETDLGAPYQPASQSCIVLNTVVPDSMEFETRSALELIRGDVGGDIDEFVRIKLGYISKTDLCKSLSAEQIDAVAMAIYNIEFRGQGMIIGDQTGIGKGRVAAAIIRYGVNQGLKPVFITEKANLFSDIYRDLSAIGSAHLIPFVVNGKESKTDIKDEQGNIIYQALPATEQQRVFKDQRIPGGYDFALATYTQFNSPEKKPEKPQFLNAIAEDNILILDESHNASGSSNTGEYLQGVVSRSRGVTFLSATFAKRPDNMPIYAMKTAMSEANMTKEELVTAITRGGVALQEVLASQLVAEGQMLRRERSFEGVEVNYMTLDHLSDAHKAIADGITEILRDIIQFQLKYINREVKELDDIMTAEGKLVDLREGTSRAGADNQPYFSKVFQVINQMLFSVKAEAVADRAILRLREGKKPVIAFASTMGSFIEQMESTSGMPVGDGDTIRTDFAEVLQKGLDGVLRYTVTEVDGKKSFKKFEVVMLPVEAQLEYQRITSKIKNVTSGITISPIDIIVKKINQAGFSTAEVTGRKYDLQINPKTGMGLIRTRKKVNTNDAFRKFNNNEVDVLLINQSGSTGASAHAIITDKVPASEVKQRVMIVLQPELDINTEVQKRGRINRTGQILKPIYDYVVSAIPAEQRLMMMLQKKLKSLDANTTSNQKNSNKILDVPDFLNKYGDRVVAEYLKENKEINTLLDDPLGIEKEKSDNDAAPVMEDAAMKVSGRVAVLSTRMQQEFYEEISHRYNELVEYLKQTGDYDLEVETMDLQAELISKRVVKVGKGGRSRFGDDSVLEKVWANVLKKPFSRFELENLLKESLLGMDAKTVQTELIAEYERYITDRQEIDLSENAEYYREAREKLSKDKRLINVLEKEGKEAFEKAVREKESELKQAEEKAAERILAGYLNRKQYMMGVLKFFYAGKRINFPIESFDRGTENVPAVCLGFLIDRKKKNPFAPSAIRLRLAIASSAKYLAVPLSQSKEINNIRGVSYNLPEYSLNQTLTQWEEAISKNSRDRSVRFIVTGNLLQAYSDYNGKLVSYTSKEGNVQKGLLLPEYWAEEEDGEKSVSVPIGRAVRLIKSLGYSDGITTNNGFTILRQGDYYKLIVAASRQRGGQFFLDKEILSLVEKNNFDKTADKMTALLKPERIEDLVKILQDRFNSSVTVSGSNVQVIQPDLEKKEEPRRNPVIKPVSQGANRIRRLELEAKALELELELIELAA